MKLVVSITGLRGVGAVNTAFGQLRYAHELNLRAGEPLWKGTKIAMATVARERRRRPRHDTRILP